MIDAAGGPDLSAGRAGMLVNMSVWDSLQTLSGFVYRSDHVAVMRQRRRWFESMRISMALWWVPAGHLPSVEDAAARLAHLGAHGPTPTAFTFRAPFAAPASLHRQLFAPYKTA